MLVRHYLKITGIVQGVGFRPFVYQSATRLGLTGWVCNTTSGVHIEVQGAKAQIEQFIALFHTQIPPLARIDSIDSQTLTVDSALPEHFEIRESHERGEMDVDISPDKKTCLACRDDILNPQSRFYHYPFTNCTHCGPRYTIIQQFPYDRVHTCMHKFPLCPQCAQEYRDPMDRRYHAQPISCPECGPQLSFYLKPSQALAQQYSALLKAAQVIAEGGVIALKGLGGFHLVCDATQASAVQKIRTLKQRQRKPLAIMVANQAVAQSWVVGNTLEWQTLNHQNAPIVLMKKRILDEEPPLSLATQVAHNNPYLGVMLPYTPLHILLFDALEKMGASQTLVMTSANRSGIPIATECGQIWAQFSDQLDGVLDHDRPIIQACDDSLVQVVANQVRVLRLARGYAPLSFYLERNLPTTVAVGAQQKSTFAFAHHHRWVLSPYLGELDDLDTQERFMSTIDWFQHLYVNQATQWVMDKHPHYFSHQYALKQVAATHAAVSQSAHSVQHHYAHILSVMAEHQLTDKLLGIALDGTGYGDDETVWGGEVLVADVHDYQRVAHVRCFRLIGRHQAIQEPARLLYALLLEAYSPAEIQAMHLSAFELWTEGKFLNLYLLWKNPTHSPLCSSAGRLFDAWAVLLGLLTQLDYEGESGLLIEAGAQAAQRTRQSSGFSYERKAEHKAETLDALELELPWQAIDASHSINKTQQRNQTAEVSAAKDDAHSGWQLDWLPALQRTIAVLQGSKELQDGQESLQHSEHALQHKEEPNHTVNQLCDAFCLAWAQAVLSICQHFPDYEVALSGGVCQNRVFMEYVAQLAPHSLADRQWYVNKTIPTNDAGIAAGQLWYSIHQQ